MSALVAIGVLSVTFWLGNSYLWFLCFFSSLACLFEFYGLIQKPLNLTGVEYKSIQVLYLLAAAALFIFSTWRSQNMFLVFPLIFIFLSGLVVWFLARKDSLSELLPLLSLLILGLCYCGLLPVISYKMIEINKFLFLSHLTVVFSGDVFSYFGGKFLGNRKLHESLSPKKTIEGSISGLIGSVIVGFFFAHLTQMNLSLAKGLILFTLTGVFAQTGDLFESFIKRNAKVKDSGFIMPGHGGALDRLDGVLFSAPVYLFLYLTLS